MHDWTWLAYCERCGQRVWPASHHLAGQHCGTPLPDACHEPGYEPGHYFLGFMGKTPASPAILRRYAGGQTPSNIMPEVLMHVDDALAALGSPLLTEQEQNRIMVALRDACALPPVCPLRTSQHWPRDAWQRDQYERRGIDFQPAESEVAA